MLSESALLHALNHVQTTDDYEPDLVVFLQATSPLRSDQDLPHAIETLLTEQADSLFSASAMHGFMWRRLKGGEWNSLTYDYRNRERRQDGPEDVFENGSFYIFKPWVLRQFGNRLGGKITVYRQSALAAFQVDELPDLDLLEQLINAERSLANPDNRLANATD